MYRIATDRFDVDILFRILTCVSGQPEFPSKRNARNARNEFKNLRIYELTVGYPSIGLC